MEKHLVVENKTEMTDDVRLRPLEQNLIVRGPDGKLYNRVCYNTVALFKPGDVIKVYKTNDAEPIFNIEAACSYKLGGKRYVDLLREPLVVLHSGVMARDSALRDFYNDLSFADSVRLNHDIARVLLQRKIKPSIFKTNNLRMFLQHKHSM